MTSDIHKSNRGNYRHMSPTITSPFRNNQPVGLTHSKTSKCSLRRMAMNRTCRKSHTRFARATLKATVTVQAETLAPCRWAAAGPGCGARGRWRGLAGLRDDVPPHTAPQASPVWRTPEGTEGQAAVPVGGGGAWPGFETTRRAKLAARTARGRAAAHGHTEQPGPTWQATRRPEHQRQQRPGIQKTDIRIGCRPSVELGGFEPPTFSLRTRRATNCAIAPRTQTA